MSNQYMLPSMPMKSFAEPSNTHSSLGGPLRFIIWLIPMIILGIIFYAEGIDWPFIIKMVLSGIVLKIIIGGMRVAAQWERGVVLRLGAFHAVKGPGLIYIVPFLDFVRFIDTRTLVLNVPSQKVITRDNVPAQIDGALFYIVTDAERAVTAIQDFQFAISQYAQAALRDIVGGMTLDELLSEREQIQNHIGSVVDEHVKIWGLRVDSIRLLDIELPEDLKRMMSRQASAEREKRATITKAEGDRDAAVNLAAAAKTMSQDAGAMQLRGLQTIDGLGASPSNTIVLFPMEWVEMAKTISNLSPEAIQKMVDNVKPVETEK